MNENTELAYTAPRESVSLKKRKWKVMTSIKTKGESYRMKRKRKRGSTQRSRQVYLSATRDRMRVIVPSPPLAAINLGAFSLNVVYVLSLQTASERVIGYTSTKGLQL